MSFRKSMMSFRTAPVRDSTLRDSPTLYCQVFSGNEIAGADRQLSVAEQYTHVEGRLRELCAISTLNGVVENRRCPHSLRFLFMYRKYKKPFSEISQSAEHARLRSNRKRMPRSRFEKCGGSSIAISARYVHPSEDAVLDAMARLGGHKTGHSAEQASKEKDSNPRLTA
jgi:hypothetical protein